MRAYTRSLRHFLFFFPFSGTAAFSLAFRLLAENFETFRLKMVSARSRSGKFFQRREITVFVESIVDQST